MMTSPSPGIRPPPNPNRSVSLSATQVFLRGLAIALPPILTLVILIWIAQATNSFVIQPVSSLVRFSIAHAVQKARPVEGLVAPTGLPSLPFCGRNYRLLPNHRDELVQKLAIADDQSRDQTLADLEDDFAFVPFGKQAVPYADYRDVAKRLDQSQMPKTAIGVYMELAATRYFQSLLHLSAVAVVISIVAVYSFGRFVTHRLGAWFVVRAGGFVRRLPLVGEIYSAVKRVTDIFLSDRERKYHRVVAIEYPRPGIWSLAFVTGEGMPECIRAASEPLVNVLIPSAPLPFAGYTMNVKQSELVDLNMTLDQAFQYVMSCGVLVPTPPATAAVPVVNASAEVPSLPGQSAQPAF